MFLSFAVTIFVSWRWSYFCIICGHKKFSCATDIHPEFTYSLLLLHKKNKNKKQLWQLPSLRQRLYFLASTISNSNSINTVWVLCLPKLYYLSIYYIIYYYHLAGAEPSSVQLIVWYFSLSLHFILMLGFYKNFQSHIYCQVLKGFEQSSIEKQSTYILSWLTDSVKICQCKGSDNNLLRLILSLLQGIWSMWKAYISSSNWKFNTHKFCAIYPIIFI